jgi:hypothetical protein
LVAAPSRQPDGGVRETCLRALKEFLDEHRAFAVVFALTMIVWPELCGRAFARVGVLGLAVALGLSAFAPF